MLTFLKFLPPLLLYKFSGNLLFTHRGISGPTILNASLFWQKGRICSKFFA
ncbi:NAD(P)/FAD-dependent oxidoreductase [Campylobacter concisus]